MVEIIKNGAVATTELERNDAESLDASRDNQIISMALYLANAEALKGRNDIGVWLPADAEIEALADCLHQLPVIALHIPAFGDGRHYSTAAILRRRYGYLGEIRAFGDVRRDQLEQMRRCGFDAFELAEGEDINNAINGLSVFSRHYQSTTEAAGVIAQRSATPS